MWCVYVVVVGGGGVAYRQGILRYVQRFRLIALHPPEEKPKKTLWMEKRSFDRDTPAINFS